MLTWLKERSKAVLEKAEDLGIALVATGAVVYGSNMAQQKAGISVGHDQQMAAIAIIFMFVVRRLFHRDPPSVPVLPPEVEATIDEALRPKTAPAVK